MLSYVYLSGAALTDTVASSLYTENNILVLRHEPYIYIVQIRVIKFILKTYTNIVD